MHHDRQCLLCGRVIPVPVSHPLHDDEPLESRLRFYPSRLCPSELGAGVNGTLLCGCLIPGRDEGAKIKDWALNPILSTRDKRSLLQWPSAFANFAQPTPDRGAKPQCYIRHHFFSSTPTKSRLARAVARGKQQYSGGRCPILLPTAPAHLYP